MGWNQIEHDETHPWLKHPSGSYFYFVQHSYALEVTKRTLATCDYGKPFTIVGGVAEHREYRQPAKRQFWRRHKFINTKNLERKKEHGKE